MLKDTLQSLMIHPYDKKTRPFDILSNLKIFGRVQVWAYKNKKELIHYDDGSNIVTIWGKHNMVGLMTGLTHSKHNYAVASATPGNVNYRDTNQTYSATVNTDGSLISGEQYFTVHSDTAYPGDLGFPSVESSNGAYDTDGHVYPLYPTKMLFGTGKEFSQFATDTDSYGFVDTWADVTEGAMLEADYGWTDVSANFDTNISDADNYYSGLIASADGSVVKAKTVNDVYAGPISTDPTDSTTVVKGAVKNGNYINTAGSITLNNSVANGSRLPDANKGIGRPAFMYFDRSSQLNRSLSSNISTIVDSSTTWENQLAYSVVMPDQLDITADAATDFYPYNGYTLKQAGLFSDAVFTPSQEEATAGSPTLTGNALAQYNQMKCGSLWAVRNIAPVQKTRDVEITIRWSLYYTL